MKKFLIPILIISGFFAFYEQSKPEPNIMITVAAIVVFMFGLFQLNSKIPSKNQENDTDDVQ